MNYFRLSNSEFYLHHDHFNPGWVLLRILKETPMFLWETSHGAYPGSCPFVESRGLRTTWLYDANLFPTHQEGWNEPGEREEARMF